MIDEVMSQAAVLKHSRDVQRSTAKQYASAGGLTGKRVAAPNGSLNG